MEYAPHLQTLYSCQSCPSLLETLLTDIWSALWQTVKNIDVYKTCRYTVLFNSSDKSHRIILTANVLRHGHPGIQFDNIFQQIGRHRCRLSESYGGSVRELVRIGDPIWWEQTERGNSDTFESERKQRSEFSWCTNH